MTSGNTASRRTRIKICGLVRPEDAAMAESSGAHFLGVILASGPRRLEPDRAAAVLGPARERVQRVGVFGERSVDELVSTADQLDLDVMQLHGDPTPDLLSELRARTDRAFWPVLRVEGTSLPPDALAVARIAGAIVLDAKVVGQLGGTCVPLDWGGLVTAVRALRDLVPGLRVILAGGLRADNVGRAMALLKPDVVDVSSGVESAPGIKDPLAVARFVSAVSAAKESGR